MSYHTQIELPRIYGSEALLEQNKLKNGYYLYDFYLGHFYTPKTERIINYFCYPYKQLDSDLSGKYFTSLFDNSKYFTPKIDVVLEYLKNMTLDNYTQMQKENVKIDVIKYSADLYEGTAKSVSLLGNNPLKSTIGIEEFKNSMLSDKVIPLFMKIEDIPKFLLEISNQAAFSH